MNDFVYVEGSKLMFAGSEIRFRGAGVGSWLNLEHFMLGLPGWDGDIQACLEAAAPGTMDRFRGCFFTAADAAYLRSIGINLIRVPINYRLFWDERNGMPLSGGYAWLTRLADICEEARLFFLPDFHAFPGGQNPDWHSESRTGSSEFWQFSQLRKQAVSIWRMAAETLCKYTYCLGYDLLNEPVLPNGEVHLLNRFYAEAVTAIREADANHIVFLEGDRFSMDFNQIEPPSDRLLAYTYHFYPAVWDERLCDSQTSLKDIRAGMKNALDEIMDSMKAYSGPLLCGEMGYELSLLDPEFGIALTRETIELMELRKSSWCLWCYKDVDFMGLLYPKPDSAWMRLVREIRKHWNHHDAQKLGMRAAEEIEKLCSYELSEAEKYELQFVIRALIAKCDVKNILSAALKDCENPAALPCDFAFEHCLRRVSLENLLRGYCQEARTPRVPCKRQPSNDS